VENALGKMLLAALREYQKSGPQASEANEYLSPLDLANP
jgi:hypothetical protein